MVLGREHVFVSLTHSQYSLSLSFSLSYMAGLCLQSRLTVVSIYYAVAMQIQT